MRKRLFSIAFLGLIITALCMLFASCATMSLQSPKPMEAGEVGLGIHAGYPLVGIGGAGQGGGFPFLITGTAQFGLGKRMELGLNVGTLGGEGIFKFGFMAPENNLQISMITGLNYLYWDILGLNAGVLGGYTFGNVARPYAGYRHHWLWPDVFMGDIIVGLELLVSKKVGLMFEFNHTISYSSFADYFDEITALNPDISYGINVLSGGFIFRL